jgi:hypothetical protein
VSNRTSFVAFSNTGLRQEKGVDAKELRKIKKIKIDASEVQAKYAALEKEICLLRDLRSQVNSKLKKQVQSQVHWSHRLSKGPFKAFI